MIVEKHIWIEEYRCAGVSGALSAPVLRRQGTFLGLHFLQGNGKAFQIAIKIYFSSNV